MTLEAYQSETFGDLDVIKGTTIDECLPWPTLTFTQSNTFSNAFLESSTFIALLPSVFSVSHRDSLTFFVHCFSLCAHVPSQLAYYAYSAVQYSSDFAFYADFFTAIYQTVAQKGALAA